MDDMKNMFGKMRDFFLGEDEEFEDYDGEETPQRSNQAQTSNSRSQQSSARKRASQEAAPNVNYNRTSKATTKQNVVKEPEKTYREEQRKVAPKPQKQAVANSARPQQTNPENQQVRKSVVRNMTEEDKLSTIVIKEPNAYSDIMEVANIVKQDESVLVNFKHMDDRQAKRSIDFCTGVVYTLDGDIQNVGGQIFLLTPSNVSVEASAELSLLARKNYEDFDL